MEETEETTTLHSNQEDQDPLPKLDLQFSEFIKLRGKRISFVEFNGNERQVCELSEIYVPRLIGMPDRTFYLIGGSEDLALTKITNKVLKFSIDEELKVT